MGVTGASGEFLFGGLKCFMRTLLLLAAHCEASGLFLLLGFRVIEIRAVGFEFCFEG